MSGDWSSDVCSSDLFPSHDIGSDIQNKTMFVSVWVKISNSAYWAGTHTNPALTITYDQTTTTSTVATNTTDWQLLSCVFTPATNYGQIEMKLLNNIQFPLF